MASFDSIYVVNISDKTAPKLTNVVHVRNPGFAGADALAIDGNALFARTPFSTEIYAVTNPKKPVFVGNIPNSHTYSRGLSIDSVNHRLFTPWLTTLQEYMGFDVYDISNPLSPKFLFADSIPFGGGEFGVSAYSYTNHVLYVTTGGSINAFDVSDSTHGFVTEFNGEDVANSSVSVQVKDSIFYNAKRGGFEVLKYTSSTEPFCPASMYLRSRVENGQAFLRWDKIDGAEGYLVRYKTADAETWSDDRFTSTNRDTLRNLSPDTKYLWNVRTVCSTSPLSRSTWARRDDFFTTEQSMDDLISFGPNPVRDIFNINIKSSQVSQLVVTDLAGNTVLQTRPLKRNNDFNFSKFRTGTYLLQVLNNRMEIIESVKVFKE